MAKCLYNGLNYPFYSVLAWMWDADHGEYDLYTLLDTESLEEARSKMNAVDISADHIAEVKIEMDDGEDVTWICTRDECGVYDT